MNGGYFERRMAGVIDRLPRAGYRDTFVFELANDYVGYIPDAQGYDRGGYQVWTGLHSYLEKGSGEAIVDAAVGLLDELHHGAGSAP
jgi:hypothetical protein